MFTPTQTSTSENFIIHPLVPKDAHQGWKLEYFEITETIPSHLKKYKEIVVCEIERDVNDPKKIANDTFYEFSWNAQGFIREPNQIVNFTWKEIGDSKISNHHMVFWRKPL